MKTTIEVGGLEIKIEELEGKVTTSFVQNGEVIEEFEFDASGESSDDEEGEDEDMMPFGEEEEDFEEEDMEDDEDMEDMEDMEEEEDMKDMEEDEEESKLESFNSFIKRRKR
jgi:hypothetical protein